MVCMSPVSALSMHEACQCHLLQPATIDVGSKLTCSSSRWMLAGHARALFCMAARYAAGDAANQFRNSRDAQPYSWSLNLHAELVPKWGTAHVFVEA